MNVNAEKQIANVTLVLEGDLTIQKASAAREELQIALKKVEHIELDMEAAKAVDLAFLQLLCSAHRTSLNMGKTLAFKGTVPPMLKKSVQDNGYARQHGCVLDVNKTCLWMMKQGEDD
jgi:anti-anti-sigma regulatory factor